VSIEFQQAGIHDVSRSNPRDILYIKGNETTPGSIRFHFITRTSPDPQETFAHIELRDSGVWNDTGLIFSGGSISLGNDLKASAVGLFLSSFNESSDPIVGTRSLYPHINYDPLDGTQDNPTRIPPKTGFPVMPVLKPELFDVFPDPDTGEVVANTISIVFPPLSERVIFRSQHQSGNVLPTTEVQVTYTDNGVVINRFNVPASLFFAGQKFDLLFEDFGFGGSNIIQTFTSTSLFSLRTNAGGNFITLQDGYLQDTVDVILEEFVITNDLSLLFNNNDPFFIVHSRFP